MEKRRKFLLFSTIFSVYLFSGVKLHIHLWNVVVWFIFFSSILQIWYVEIRISRSISESPLGFEITRVDYIFVGCSLSNLINANLEYIFAGLASAVHHGYLVNYYNAHRSIFVNDSMILELTNRFLSDEPTDNFVSCNVIVTTSPSRRIHLHFLSLEISYDDESIDRFEHSFIQSVSQSVINDFLLWLRTEAYTVDSRYLELAYLE